MSAVFRDFAIVGMVAALVVCSAAANGRGSNVGQLASASPGYQAGTSGGRPTVWDGVYSQEQGKRGQQLYERYCSSCHEPDLRGRGHAVGLVGEPFWLRWKDGVVGELYERIRVTMPLDAPGWLSPQEYAAVVSYVLQANEFPAGKIELPADAAALNRILIQEKASQGQ